MSFYEKILDGTPTLSFEIFPPKNPAGWGALYTTLGEIVKQNPDFISVTYGAGGSTREKTVDLVRRIQRELEIDAVAHLTCVGHSRTELSDILASLSDSKIGAVMALRGDAPKGAAAFTPHPEGFHYASELIGFARSSFKLRLGCAYYPEKHPEAESLDSDITHLKEKQDAGADFAVSQFFFDNEVYYRFRDKAREAGVTLPLIAGIVPLAGLRQLAHFQALCGAAIPAKLLDYIGDSTDDETIARKGVDFGIEQCRDLLDNGIAGIHLYTLNKSTSSIRIVKALRTAGYFPKPEASLAKR